MKKILQILLFWALYNSANAQLIFGNSGQSLSSGVSIPLGYISEELGHTTYSSFKGGRPIYCWVDGPIGGPYTKGFLYEYLIKRSLTDAQMQALPSYTSTTGVSESLQADFANDSPAEPPFADITIATKILNDGGSLSDLDGFIWVQGEAMHATYTDWSARTTQLKAWIMEDFGLTELPFVVHKSWATNANYDATIRPQQQAFADSSDDHAIVDSKNIARSDTVHPYNAGYHLLASKLLEAMSKLLDGFDWPEATTFGN